MFSEQLINRIKEAIPELQDLQLTVGGRALSIGGYEMLNALLIQNNVIDNTNKNIAIFHPKEDLLDIYILVIMGLSAYKFTIIQNAKLKQKDFTPGELVEYNGKVAWYQGIHLDPEDKTEKFQIDYNDIYSNTSVHLPLQFFSAISKYIGNKTTADKFESKKAKGHVKDALRILLGFNQEQIGLYGYPTFLISSERSRLVELLKETAINGIPFFEMFPSVKCTTEKRQRLGRDIAQRSFMFFFVSSLSTADDILRAEPGIKTLMVDARGKALNNSSLLASIRNQYNLEDIYWLQTYERFDSVDNLDRGLGFKIWIWDQRDFAELAESDVILVASETNFENEFAAMAEEHNKVSARLANYTDIALETPYPEGMTLEQHNVLHFQVRELFSLSNDYGNTDLLKFTIRLAGVVSRIFQSSLPPEQTDVIFKNSGRRTFDEDLDFLREWLKLLANAVLPEDFKIKALELLSSLKFFIDVFRDYYGKCNQVVSIAKENQTGKICVFINPKYPLLQSVFGERVISELEKTGHRSLGMKIVITDNLTQAVGCDIIIWTFKPTLGDNLMVEPGVGKNFILLYPLQKKAFELSLLFNSRHFQQYQESEYRAAILKVPLELLEKTISPPTQIPTTMEIFDLEKLLSSTIAKVLPTYRVGEQSEMVNARMVLFSDGTHALFQSNHKIKVLDLEHKTIETKTVNSLSEADEIAFLKDSTRTVFEELVGFYQHEPEIIKLIKLSELWRTALLSYKEEHHHSPLTLKRALDGVGLIRHIVTIESWLDGTTICPDEDNYAPVDIIAQLTNNSTLKENLENVKTAARKMHALRIKIGRYLVKKITQSFVSPDSIIDDPILRDKLDEISSHVRIAQVSAIGNEMLQVSVDLTNKLLTAEDM